MQVRVIGLSLGAAAILAGAVYLFLQVTDDPGPSAAPAATVADSDDDEQASDKTTTQPDRPAWKALPRTGSGTLTPGGSGEPPKVDQLSGGKAPTLDPDDGERPDPEVDMAAAMDEANKLYDGNDYEGASKQALRVLAKDPENVRMLRVVVSSACLMGDAEQANKFMPQLPSRDQDDMIRRCGNAEIQLTKPTRAATPGAGARIKAE